MTPHLARLRNYTYSMPIMINITVDISIKDNNSITTLPRKTFNNILLGKIPIMVGSSYCMVVKYPHLSVDECKYDKGGYTIINGNEKVIITQEKIANNIIQVFKLNKVNNKYSYVAEIRSCNEQLFTIPKLVSVKMTNKKNDNLIYITIPNIKVDIPITILFRLFGYESDKEICYSIIDGNDTKLDNKLLELLIPSLINNFGVKTEAEAYKYLIKYLQNNVINLSDDKKILFIKKYVLKNYLPHLNTNKKKVLFTGYLINCILKCHLNIYESDDRDSYSHKRLDTPGILLGNLTYQCINKIHRDMKNSIIKEINSGLHNINNDNNYYNHIINDINIHKLLKSSYLETTLKSALATGNWGLKSNTNKMGVSQVLSRLTYLSTISHLRRVSTTADGSTGILIQPRKLHPTSWGMICPTETPEGQSIGLIKNLSTMCEITNYNTSSIIRDIIKEYIIDIEDIDIFSYSKNNTKIFINGDWIGSTEDPCKFIKMYKSYRSKNIINIYNSIYIDNIKNNIYIFTDRGRCIRPLLKVENSVPVITNEIISKLNSKYTWNDLTVSVLNEYNTQYIEYIDCYETNNILILPKVANDSIDKYSLLSGYIHILKLRTIYKFLDGKIHLGKE